MSHAAVYEPADEPVLTHTSADPAQPPLPRRGSRGGVLLASLAGALVTTCLSGASLYYAFTHIPEVDTTADAAPAAVVAAVDADALATPDKLQVLTPPVYAGDMLSEAPAAPFVPLNAQVSVSAVDMNALAQADGAQTNTAQADDARPCADPCSAQAGYEVPTDAGQPAPMPVANVARHADADADDDGNAPPPPDMTVN